MAEKNETDFILNYMSEVEAVAEEILTSKQHMIELDKKRQKSREAIRFVHDHFGSLRRSVLLLSAFLLLFQFFFYIMSINLYHLIFKDLSLQSPYIVQVLCPFSIRLSIQYNLSRVFFPVAQSVLHFTHREPFGKVCAVTLKQVSKSMIEVIAELHVSNFFLSGPYILTPKPNSLIFLPQRDFNRVKCVETLNKISRSNSAIKSEHCQTCLDHIFSSHNSILVILHQKIACW